MALSIPTQPANPLAALFGAVPFSGTASPVLQAILAGAQGQGATPGALPVAAGPGAGSAAAPQGGASAQAPPLDSGATPQPEQTPPQGFPQQQQAAQGMPQQPQQQDPSQVPNAAAGFPAPPMYAPRSRVGDILDSLLLDGAMRKTADAAYQRQMANYMAMRTQAFLRQLSPTELKAYIANPEAFAKSEGTNLEASNVAGGDTRYFGNGQAPFTAPKSFSDTTNGVAGFVGPNGQITGSGYPTIQTAKPGETISPLAPVALGAPPSVGTAASGPSAPAPVGSMVAAANGAVPSVDAPRGIRNANPGNLTALPNGQQWDGQIGVDPQGYVKFATPQAGIAAALKNLHSYATKDGINTVAALVARWAPQGAGNNVQAYANYVASALGVKPTDKIDLTNPQIASAAANAIFAYENGPKAWAAHSGAATPVVPVATANTGAYPATLQGGKVSPATYDPHLDAYTQTEPGGKQDVVEPNPFGVKQQLEYTTNFINTPQYKDYDQLSRFYDTAQQALQRQGGPADLQLIDMAIKANNPTLGARPNQVDQAINEIGPLNMWGGQIKAVVDNGQRLSPAARQAMVNVVADARNAAWRGLQPLVAKADRDAKKMGLTRDDLLPGLTPPTSPPTSSGFGPDHPQLAPTGAPDKFAATYAALPSGARYQAPDGSWRVKR